MHRCCPDTCQVGEETHFNETVCNSKENKKQDGKCVYPFQALKKDCYKGNDIFLELRN